MRHQYCIKIQYRIDADAAGQSPISRSVKGRKLLAPHLGNHPKLVIGHHLKQRLGQQAQALDLRRRRASIPRLVILPHGVDSLLNQRLAGLDHSDEGALVQMPCLVQLIA